MNNHENGIQLRREVLLAFQDALLGMVTPNLRGVSTSWTDSHISGAFFYDGIVSEFEEEIVSEAETYVVSHFNNHTIELIAKEVPAELNIKQLSVGTWVYLRFE